MSEPSLSVAENVAALRATVAGWRAVGARVALVPTMGALHAGHLALVELARTRADRVVASIFVNPTQFAPGEDFERYPRPRAEDERKLASVGCDLLFAPSPAEMYPAGDSTRVRVSGVSEPMDGLARPTHFEGVATIVAKLLIQTAPDVAVFGEKDYQQLQVIRRMTRDLHLPVEIVGAPTVREPDGLALSSRNVYLSPGQRIVAGALPRILSAAAAKAATGDIADVEAEATAALLAAGFDTVDYVEVRRANDLSRFEGPVNAPGRILVAARLGATRLIDNMPVG